MYPEYLLWKIRKYCNILKLISFLITWENWGLHYVGILKRWFVSKWFRRSNVLLLVFIYSPEQYSPIHSTGSFCHRISLQRSFKSLGGKDLAIIWWSSLWKDTLYSSFFENSKHSSYKNVVVNMRWKIMEISI